MLCQISTHSEISKILLWIFIGFLFIFLPGIKYYRTLYFQPRKFRQKLDAFLTEKGLSLQSMEECKAFNKDDLPKNTWYDYIGYREGTPLLPVSTATYSRICYKINCIDAQQRTHTYYVISFFSTGFVFFVNFNIYDQDLRLIQAV